MSHEPRLYIDSKFSSKKFDPKQTDSININENLQAQLNKIKSSEQVNLLGDLCENLSPLDLECANSLNHYKNLKLKNSYIEKFRTEYYHHFFKNIRSIFDKKQKADEDSLSEEEKCEHPERIQEYFDSSEKWQTKGLAVYDNEIQFCRDFNESENNDQSKADQHDGESKALSRARDAPYRMIVVPGYLYELFDLTFIKEIV